jgi:SAM-dependent methyltransferase
MSKTNWDTTYVNQGSVWGDRPSELAVFALELLRSHTISGEIEIAELGCGYGRDAVFLARNLGCSVTAIDNSPKAIEMAHETCPAELKDKLHFFCTDFEKLKKPYPVIFASNMYQILPLTERTHIEGSIMRHLRPGGILFLSSLSINDPEEYGRGAPVEGDEGSFQREKFLHFSTRDEIEKAFSFLTIDQLFEHEYLEPHAGGKPHHHISWMLAASSPQTTKIHRKE